MQSPSMGNVYLLGADSNIWEDADPVELVCLRPRKADSAFARLFTDRVCRWYHHLIGYLFRVSPSRLGLFPSPWNEANAVNPV